MQDNIEIVGGKICHTLKSKSNLKNKTMDLNKLGTCIIKFSVFYWILKLQKNQLTWKGLKYTDISGDDNALLKLFSQP